MDAHGSAPTTLPTFRAELQFAPAGPNVVLHGRCSADTASTIVSVLEAACFNQPRRLTIDVNSIDHMDGEVMAALLAFRHAVTDTIVIIDVRHLSGTRLMELMASARAATSAA